MIYPAVQGPVVLAYDFPHKKTQDIILRLVALNRKPAAVVAAPPVALRLPPPAVRVKARHADLIEPESLCISLGIPYFVVDHASSECQLIISDLRADIGLVAGARILPASTIACFPRGIVNLHPGLLPATRGLDALQWAIYREQALGVTAHLIDHRVDAGYLLETRTIDEYPDDTLVDLSLRLYETQLDMLDDALATAMRADSHTLTFLAGGKYNRSFPTDLVPQMRRKFRVRKARLRAGRDAIRERVAEIVAVRDRSSNGAADGGHRSPESGDRVSPDSLNARYG